MDKEEDKRKAEIIEEICADKRFAKIFEQYNEHSIQYFIKEYARYKAMLEHNGNFLMRRETKRMEMYLKMAEECLMEIQYKKLFDLECQWRANQVKLPGVNITFDFKVIGENIFYTELIPPITEEDLHLYREYLMSPFNNFIVFSTYEDFEHVRNDFEKDEEDEENSLSGYYRFHNHHTDAYKYLSLPDIRSEKEWFYIRLRHSKEAKQQPPSNPLTIKPILFSTYENMAEVAKKMGDHELNRYLLRSEIIAAVNDSRIEEAFSYLYYEKDPVTISHQQFWGEALMEAANRHKSQQIAGLLKQAWEELKMKKEMDIRIKPDREWSFAKLRDKMMENVLNGRELNGEPRDFNF